MKESFSVIYEVHVKNTVYFLFIFIFTSSKKNCALSLLRNIYLVKKDIFKNLRFSLVL